MIISSINSVPMARNYGKVKSNKNQNVSNTLNNSKAAYKPSFGLDPAFWVGSLIGIYVSYRIDVRRNKKEMEKLQEQYEKEISSISNKLNINHEEAEEYFKNYLRIAEIPQKGNGDEIGLNAVMGYGQEKYKVAVDFITPIVAKEKQVPNIDKNIPNGMLMYGPPGSGKTYIAQKACEHLDYNGVNVENILLDPTNHKKSATIIREAFDKGKARYERLGKQTVINFINDIDNFFLDRNQSNENIPEITTFLQCAENCAQSGVTWVATANNPRRIDPAVLRAGRTDIKLPVGKMDNFAVTDTIKYFLLKHGEKASATELNYESLVEAMEEELFVFTPAELELIVKTAKNQKEHPDALIDHEKLIDIMFDYQENEFPTLNSDSMSNFRLDREYADKIKYEPKEEQEIQSNEDKD